MNHCLDLYHQHSLSFLCHPVFQNLKHSTLNLPPQSFTLIHHLFFCSCHSCSSYEVYGPFQYKHSILVGNFSVWIHFIVTRLKIWNHFCQRSYWLFVLNLWKSLIRHIAQLNYFYFRRDSCQVRPLYQIPVLCHPPRYC